MGSRIRTTTTTATTTTTTTTDERASGSTTIASVLASGDHDDDALMQMRVPPSIGGCRLVAEVIASDCEPFDGLSHVDCRERATRTRASNAVDRRRCRRGAHLHADCNARRRRPSPSLVVAAAHRRRRSSPQRRVSTRLACHPTSRATTRRTNSRPPPSPHLVKIGESQF